MQAVLEAVLPVVPEPKYPALARLRQTGKVVLFMGLAEGFVVVPDNDHKIGESSDWVPVTTPSLWEILPPGSAVHLVQD
jgi:hypothetical protein